MNKILHSIIVTSLILSVGVSAEEVKKQLTLEELISKNIKTDPLIKKQRLQLEISDLELDKQWGDWLPKVDLTAYAGKEDIKNPNGDTTRFSMEEYKVDVKQLIYDFKIDSEIKKKRLDRDYANLTYESTQQGLLYRNITAYFNLIKEYKQLENDMSNQSNVGKQLLAEDKKIKAGKGSKTDLLQIQAGYQRAVLNVNTARSQLTNAVSNYYRNFYAYPVKVVDMKTPYVPYELLPDAKEKASEISLSENPQLKMLDIDLEKISIDRKIDMAKFLPKIDLEAKSQWKKDLSGIAGRKNEYYVKGVLTYNLFNGMKDKKSLEINSLKRMQQKESLTDAQNAQKERVSIAWESHHEAIKNYATAKKEVAFYDEFVSKIDRQRELGKANMLDVLDAQTKQLNAKTTLLDAQTRKDLSVFALLLEMGRLDMKDIKTVSN